MIMKEPNEKNRGGELGHPQQSRAYRFAVVLGPGIPVIQEVFFCQEVDGQAYASQQG
jgi:hypothetical protein